MAQTDCGRSARRRARKGVALGRQQRALLCAIGAVQARLLMQAHRAGPRERGQRREGRQGVPHVNPECLNN